MSERFPVVIGQSPCLMGCLGFSQSPRRHRRSESVLLHYSIKLFVSFNRLIRKAVKRLKIATGTDWIQVILYSKGECVVGLARMGEV